ncbi:MAG: alpha/beta fold hydrolase [bacterium]
MKNFVIITLLLSTSLYSQNSANDTLVDIGGYHIQFYILEGQGNPILFESGAGDNGSVWTELAQEVHEVTGTTVIYYDRSGFGNSELNPNHKNYYDYGIVNGVSELERGLQKLGYFKNLLLVSHSYGGFYTTLFSSRNPNKVLYNIRVDANLANQYTKDIIAKAEKDNAEYLSKVDHAGQYYLGINFPNTLRLMWQTEYPTSVPAIDIVSPIQRHHTNEEWTLLQKVHKDFVEAEANRTGIIAKGSGHYIYKDNPGLVLNTIIKAYVSCIDDVKEKSRIQTKALDKLNRHLINLKSNE